MKQACNLIFLICFQVVSNTKYELVPSVSVWYLLVGQVNV